MPEYRLGGLKNTPKLSPRSYSLSLVQSSDGSAESNSTQFALAAETWQDGTGRIWSVVAIGGEGVDVYRQIAVASRSWCPTHNQPSAYPILSCQIVCPVHIILLLSSGEDSPLWPPWDPGEFGLPSFLFLSFLSPQHFTILCL